MIVSIVQARTKSTRFPRKIYEDINGVYDLQRVLGGLKNSKVVHKIVLAMPLYDQEEFEQRFSAGEFEGFIDERFGSYFGSSNDLVDRYFQAARKYNADIVIRNTADCPLLQGKIIDEMVIEYMKGGCNGFMSNNNLICPAPYPDGLDTEIFPYWMLAEAHQMTTDSYHREHVTPYMYRRGTGYNIYQFNNTRPNTMINTRFPDFSFDTPEDLKLIKCIAKEYDKHSDLDRAIKEAVVD
jgi:spore coat polysaccharide biosynthesis protein SpsF (cytidylyltransferase family)